MGVKSFRIIGIFLILVGLVVLYFKFSGWFDDSDEMYQYSALILEEESEEVRQRKEGMYEELNRAFADTTPDLDGWLSDYIINPHDEVQLAKAPVLKITVVDEEGEILPEFPVRIEHGFKQNGCELFTDENGYCELPLFGFLEGEYTLIVYPSVNTRAYKIPIAGRSDSRLFVDRRESTLMRKWETFVGHSLRPETDVYENAKEEMLQEIRDRKAKREQRPEHPNYISLDLKYKEVKEVQCVYHRSGAEKDFSITAVNDRTGESISEFSGILTQGFDFIFENFILPNRYSGFDESSFEGIGDYRTFQSDQNGHCTLLRISPEPGRWLIQRNFPREKPDPQSTAFFGLTAPGYVPQIFPVYVDDYMSQTEFQFRLKEEAVLRCKLIDPSTNEPYILEKDSDGMMMGSWSNGFDIDLTNSSLPKLKGGRSYDRHFAAFPEDLNRTLTVFNGVFEIDGLFPGDGWLFEVKPPGFDKMPLGTKPFSMKVDLKPGVNDLGDIKVEINGE